MRVLVAESNHDLRYLYQTYLDSLGLDMEIVDGGEACLNRLFKNTNNSNFDIVIINTHLFDISGLVIAKEIHQRNPSQKIVITTTILRERLPKEHLDSAGIDHEYVLTIPFRVSDMMHFLSR
ncbi:MAG TPA: response regulator [Phototrophicaceae bacterium]|nr:response regulator [Phototrophicaceae bacterium]